VFKTVYAHCLMVLVCLGYYCVFKCLHLSCRGKTSVARRTHPVMSEMMPRLTLYNVWILVYGLGLVLFITGYCFLGLHPVCLACAALGMGVLSVDELVCPRHHLSPWYAGMRCASLFVTLIALVLVSAALFETEMVHYVTTLDLYSLFFGMAFPFGGQFIMIAVRDNRRHTLGTVLEVCEFGFPFATFLGIFHLSVAYGQRFQLHSDSENDYYSDALGNQTSALYYYWYYQHNLTAADVIRSDQPFLLFYLLGPFFMVPGMICYVSSIVEGTAVDSLLSLTSALCVEHLIMYPTGPGSPLGIYGTVFISIAIIIRVMSEYTPSFRQPVYVFQTESTQLPFSLIWGNNSRRAREVEELTRELDPVNC
jgi:hypothetical protein